MSHSNSNTSFGEGVVMSDSSELHITGPCSPKAVEPPITQDSTITQDSKSGVVTDLQGEKGTEPGVKLRICGDRKSDLSGVASCQYKSDTEGIVHQRSRSNEMEYVSLRSNGRRRPRLHSFRSPPGSMQTFTSCRREINPPPAQTKPSVGSPVGSGDSPPPPMSDDATPSAEDHSEPRGNGEGEGETPERVSADQFSLLKEFDSSVWSNYFTSLETPEC